MAGADAGELEEIVSPHGRVLALGLRAHLGLARRLEPGGEVARYEALLEVLRYLYGEEEAGAIQDAILAVKPDEQPPNASLYRHFDEILDDPTVEAEMVVANRLPIGLTVFAGRPKVGKGWF